MFEHAYQMDFGAKAADYVKTVMAVINPDKCRSFYEKLWQGVADVCGKNHGKSRERNRRNFLLHLRAISPKRARLVSTNRCTDGRSGRSAG